MFLERTPTEASMQRATRHILRAFERSYGETAASPYRSPAPRNDGTVLFMPAIKHNG